MRALVRGGFATVFMIVGGAALAGPPQTPAPVANGSQAKDEARANVDKAWVQVKADWRKLHAAAPEGWDNARAAYEAASARLKSAWEKIEPQG